MRSPGRAPHGTSRWCPQAPHGLESDREGGFTPTVRLSIMAAALLFVSSPCPLARATCMHPPYTYPDPLPVARNGGRGGAPAPLLARSTSPQGKGDAVSRVWALSRQVLPTGRRVAGRSRGLGPWPGPPPSPGARHFCRRCPWAGPSSNPPVVSPQSAVPHVCGGDTQTPASVNPKRRRPPRLSGEGLSGPKAKEAPSPQQQGPW